VIPHPEAKVPKTGKSAKTILARISVAVPSEAGISEAVISEAVIGIDSLLDYDYDYDYEL